MYLSGVVQPDMPAMITPRMGQIPADGQLWAADNGRFNSPHEYSDAKYADWLGRMRDCGYADRCLFATAPDVVGDAAATLAMSAPMLHLIRAIGYRAAFVAQDGLTVESTPWDDFDALFVGGTTDWKLSEAAVGLVLEAKRRGKWTHMGRVNSLRRMRFAASIGCDSVDGTFLKFGPDVNRERMARWFEAMHREPMVWS